MRLGKTLLELNNRVARSTEIGFDPAKGIPVMIAPPVIETHVSKYNLRWFGLRRKLVGEFNKCEKYLEDLDYELDRMGLASFR